MGRDTPVIMDASSLSRNTVGAAISAPLPAADSLTSDATGRTGHQHWSVLEVDHGSLFPRSFDVRPVLKEYQ
jgi:hypothetical protein